MKIRIYAVTYNSPRILNDWFLESLSRSNYDRQNTEIFIINNHSNFFVEDKYKELVTILNNDLRPDFSTGHLTRNWNQAIINGFENLNAPACDLVVACHGDTKLKQNWYEGVVNAASKYKYITFGCGDQFQIFTTDSIKNIGLYDERFCGIGYQEADYFLRARIYFEKFSSINDPLHGRQLNPIGQNGVLEETTTGYLRKDVSTMAAMKYHPIIRQFYDKKWNMSDRWEGILDFSKIKPRIPIYILYPYFESDINAVVYE